MNGNGRERGGMDVYGDSGFFLPFAEQRTKNDSGDGRVFLEVVGCIDHERVFA